MAEVKRIVITGASDGIGAAAAKDLVERGHEVIIVGRSPEKTARVADALGAASHVADFADLDQVERLAEKLTSLGRIDVLANNAGGLFGDRAKTKDGFETTFQVNHLAPFLLTTRLLTVLEAGRASVIQTASAASRIGRVTLADLQHDRFFTPMYAYGTTKLENILFTTELQRRHGASGISAVAFHPGIIGSNFSSGSTSPVRFFYSTGIAQRVLSTVEQGAAPLVRFAVGAPGTDWTPGAYYEGSNPSRGSRQARAADLAAGLWERSESLLAEAGHPL